MREKKTERNTKNKYIYFKVKIDVKKVKFWVEIQTRNIPTTKKVLSTRQLTF